MDSDDLNDVGVKSEETSASSENGKCQSKIATSVTCRYMIHTVDASEIPFGSC